MKDAASTSRAFVIGISIGWVLTIVGFLLAGAGHGTLIPLLIIQGPLALLRPIADISPTAHNVVGGLALLATPLLYGAYFPFLRGQEVVGRRFVYVALAHLAAAAASIWQFAATSGATRG